MLTAYYFDSNSRGGFSFDYLLDYLKGHNKKPNFTIDIDDKYLIMTFDNLPSILDTKRTIKFYYHNIVINKITESDKILCKVYKIDFSSDKYEFHITANLTNRVIELSHNFNSQASMENLILNKEYLFYAEDHAVNTVEFVNELNELIDSALE